MVKAFLESSIVNASQIEDQLEELPTWLIYQLWFIDLGQPEGLKESSRGLSPDSSGRYPRIECL